MNVVLLSYRVTQKSSKGSFHLTPFLGEYTTVTYYIGHPITVEINLNWYVIHPCIVDECVCVFQLKSKRRARIVKLPGFVPALFVPKARGTL